MTCKDYELIARVLREQLDIGERYSEEYRAALGDAAVAFTIELAADNPRLDRERFLRACGVED